jgi:ribosome-associated protein
LKSPPTSASTTTKSASNLSAPAALAGKTSTKWPRLLIEAKRYRTQEQNRLDAISRLAALIQKALAAPKNRHATRPTLASKTERIQSKKRRGAIKQNRRKPGNWE